SALHLLFLCSHQPSWQQSHQHSWQQSHQLSGSNLISIPGSNLISFTQLQFWLLRDAFTPGCHQYSQLQNISSSCSLNSNSECKTPPLHEYTNIYAV
ncbi:unnamed protein product, partial [Staurois parvus]